MSVTVTFDDALSAELETAAQSRGVSMKDYVTGTMGRLAKADQIARYVGVPHLSRYQNYLYREAVQGETSPDAALRTLRFLYRLFDQIPDCPPPDMGAAERQILCVWDKGEHHLELEVFADGDGEWFYMNRETHAVWEEDWKMDAPASQDAKNKVEQMRHEETR